jgi:AraC-like DNA-binding protein
MKLGSTAVPSMNFVGLDGPCTEIGMYLYALTALAHTDQDKAALKSVLSGDIRSATRLAQQRTEDECRLDDPAAYMHWATLCGDLMLAQDHDEDAEMNYRRALRGAAGGDRGQTRVAACRNTGFMSLHQQRFSTAAVSFQRVVADAATSTAGQVEALCGLAAAQNGMGDAQQAKLTLGAAARRSHESTSPELAIFTDLWSIELQVQHAVRAHTALRDHIFWRSPAVVSTQSASPEQLMKTVDTCIMRYRTLPLIAQRLHHLRDLMLAIDGDAQALRESQHHLLWLGRAGLVSSERQARLEWALAALTVKNAEVAHDMLKPLCLREDQRGVRRWDFELSYCRAKLCELQGRSEESLRHYQRYALESVMCVRSEMTPPTAPRHDEATEVLATGAAKDEVEMSLPAKYRRAYRYLVAHLGDEGLNVHEIADQIGVTMRALQSAFKSHLGMSPAEVLRRCRMERIRSDLLAEDGSLRTIAEVASRWGVRSRATLVSSYRKHFGETPEQTLGRRHTPLQQ